jgi:alkyldihydroxyacetonephosphate synthase
MLRLSDSQETEITFALAGKSLITTLADQSFKFIGYGPGRCLLIFGITGNSRTVASTRRRAKAIFRSHGSFLPLAAIGRMWRKSRFLSPYLRNTLWDLGYAVDTLETATPWSAVPKLGFEIKQALTTAIEETGEPLLTFAHLSHVYPDGASTYVTLIFRRGESPEETLERWQRLKAAASQAVINRGGTITHQHGVGMDHAHYLPNEKGPIGMALLKAVSKELDPHGILNPGKMFTLP